MATYYADLSLSGSGGDGSSGTPWHINSFALILDNQQLAAGSIINVKGEGSYGGVVSCWSPGTLATDLGYTIQNWETDKPWRINVTAFNNKKGGYNNYYGGIIRAAGIENHTITNYANCFIITNGLFIWDAANGSYNGTSTIKGCTVYSENLLDGHLLRPYGTGVILDCKDSIFSSITPTCFANSGAIINSTNCVFTDTPDDGTHIDYQANWTPPVWPVWNAPLSSSFNKYVLSYHTITTPPKPGFGYSSYSGYEVDLSGNIRNDIGAYATKIYYVDLDSSYIETGDGSGLNPFNYSQFISASVENGSTFKFKGQRDLGVDNFARLGSGTGLYYEAWDLSLYGPWRIKSNTININVTTSGSISGGIIYSDLNIEITSGKILNMFLRPTRSLQLGNYNIINNEVKGCTIAASSNIIYALASSTNVVFTDCIIDEAMNVDSTFNNCTFRVADWGIGTKTNCQFGWTPPIWPAWNASLSLFSKTPLSYSTITTPPKPGIGSPSYTEYATNLTGALRNDIGAYTSDTIPSDYTYTVDGSNNATITGYTGTGGDISIPDTLDGYPVVAIGDSAFINNLTLTSVVIPVGVTSIGHAAFNSCTNLASVTLPDGLLSIGGSAFAVCALTSLSIPSTVTTLEEQAIAGNPFTSFTIPNTVTSLGQGMFYQCTSLESAVLPTNLTDIPASTFEGCSSLSSVTIPANVTTINSSAFKDCVNLTSISLPSGVEQIKNRAFSNTGLTSIEFPASVSVLYDDSFGACADLITATFNGNAPTMIENDGVVVFQDHNINFEVFYQSGATGFTEPLWPVGNGDYPTQQIVGPPTYSVTYNGNGNTEGTAPVDTTEYLNGDPVSILSAGSLVKVGFTFSKWNTSDNALGTDYSPGDIFSMGTNNVTLYAIWAEKVPPTTVVRGVTYKGVSYSTGETICATGALALEDGSAVSGAPAPEEYNTSAFDPTIGGQYGAYMFISECTPEPSITVSAGINTMAFAVFSPSRAYDKPKPTFYIISPCRIAIDMYPVTVSIRGRSGTQ